MSLSLDDNSQCKKKLLVFVILIIAISSIKFNFYNLKVIILNLKEIRNVEGSV